MILSLIVIVSASCQKHKCRMSTQWGIVALYLCNFLENRFSGDSTSVLTITVILIINKLI